MNDIPIIIYTHTDFNDVFSIALKRHEKYSTNFQKIIFSNKIQEGYDTILYNDSHKYSTRLYTCLMKLNTVAEYILLNHDWVILYDHINKEKITNITKIMKENNIHQVRLWFNGIPILDSYDRSSESNTYDETKCIFNIPKNGAYQFTQQPTLWHLNTLKAILLNHLEFDYRSIELSTYEHMLQYKNCFYYNNEEQFTPNGFFKSSIYPHIHITSSGKWIISYNLPYSQEMIDEYAIDVSIRGAL